MVGMSHIWWPEDIAFKLVTLEPEERSCGHCGRFAYVNDRKHRYLHSLGDPLHVVSLVRCCPDKGCAGHAEQLTPMAEMSIAPPFWSVSWRGYPYTQATEANQKRRGVSHPAPTAGRLS